MGNLREKKNLKKGNFCGLKLLSGNVTSANTDWRTLLQQKQRIFNEMHTFNKKKKVISNKKTLI